MVSKLNMLILTAALLSGFGLVLSADAAGVRFSKGRTYVMGYEVQGNFAVPVMGVITDEINMGAGIGAYGYRPYVYPPYNYQPYDRTQYVLAEYPESSAPFRMSARDVAALRAFLADTLPPRRSPIQ